MKHKTPQTPIVENPFDEELIKGFKKTDSDREAANAIYSYYMAPIKAMLKKIMDDNRVNKFNKLTSRIFERLLQKKEAIRNTQDLLTITFIEAKKVYSSYLKNEPRKQMKQQLDDLQNVFYEIEHLQEDNRSIMKTCLQNKDEDAVAKQLNQHPSGLPFLIKKSIDALVDKLEKEENIKSLHIFWNIFLPLLLNKTSYKIIIENASDEILIKDWNTGKTAAIEAVYNYYMVPIAAMLKKTMDTKDVEAIVRITLTKMARDKETTHMLLLLRHIFNQAERTCSNYLKDESQKQMKQQLDDLQNVFYEIEHLQEDNRTIIKTCLQNEERAAAAKQLNEPLSSLSTLVKNAIDVLVAKLEKEENIKSLHIFREIFLPLLLKEN